MLYRLGFRFSERRTLLRSPLKRQQHVVLMKNYSTSNSKTPQPQKHDSHGAEHKMDGEPRYSADWYKGSGKLKDRVAIITGGDSGIGRAVAVLYAREGADVAIGYFKNDKDAEETKSLVEKEGRTCLTFKGDISKKSDCTSLVQSTIQRFKRLDILVNNAAVQFEQKSIDQITEEQLDTTFRTNIYSMFFVTQAALKYLEESDYASIINTTSVTAYKGNESLLDYSSTKGAIIAFTRSLSQNLAEKKIRVNAVAPGPIWTPLIPSSFDSEHLKQFGKNTPLGRAGQPDEVAPAYVYLASRDSSYVLGQVININGGYPV